MVMFYITKIVENRIRFKHLSYYNCVHEGNSNFCKPLNPELKRNKTILLGQSSHSIRAAVAELLYWKDLLPGALCYYLFFIIVGVSAGKSAVS